MGSHFDISGSWRGHYEQAGSRHGISMIVAQRGQSMVGRMRDDETVLSTARPQLLYLEPIDEPHGLTTEGLTADGGVNASAAERPVEMETIATLPEHSVVEGDVNGDLVEFEKRYLGPHEITSWIDGRAEAHYTLHDHRVRYEGRLDGDGACLRGRWLLGPAGDPHLTGAFELRRDPAAQ